MKRSLGAAFYYWRMAILKASGKAIMAGITSIVATLNGVEWADFTNTQKFVAIATGVGAMWLVVDAFLDQTMHQLQPQVFKVPPDSTLLEQKMVSQSDATGRQTVETREEKPVATTPVTGNG